MPIQGSGVVGTRRRVGGKSTTKLSCCQKWELRLRGLGQPGLCIPAPPALGCCGWCGQGGVAEAHDHKGPTRTQDIGAVEVRGECALSGTLTPQAGVLGTQGGSSRITHDQGRKCGGAGLAKGQRLQSALAHLRHRPRAGVLGGCLSLVCEKILFLPGVSITGMAPSWHHPWSFVSA